MIRILPVLITCVILSSCGTEEPKKPLQNLISFFHRLEYKSDSLDQAMIRRFDDSLYTGMYCSEYFHQFDSLKKYYSRNEYQALWLKAFREPEEIDEIIAILQKSYRHGLDSSWYHLSLLRQMREELEVYLDSGFLVDHLLLADMELVLSDAVVQYSLDMRRGVVDPLELYSTDYLLPYHQIDSGTYFEALGRKDLGKYLLSLSPKDARYTQMMEALEAYRQLEFQGEWDSLYLGTDDPKFTLEPGDTSVVLYGVIDRLKHLNFLDSSYHADTLHPVLDSLLSSSVALYQSSVGLYSDGVIGRRSIDEMNVPLKERIWCIRVNMERFRWMSYPRQGKYAKVNIPEYTLYILADTITVDTMKVCVGIRKPPGYWEKLELALKTGKTSLRPKDMETPCLQSRFSYIVLNPKWNIPQSIAENEIFWSILKNPSYLQEENIRVYLGGELVDPDTIQWKTYRGKKLPFQFKQDPGTFNSLGIIKFIFDNKFSIYLHDTPNKKAFLGSMRAVSHGCVRLEQPLELAAFLISGNPDWTMNRVKVELGLPPDEEADTALTNRYEEVLSERSRLRETKSAIQSERIYLKEKTDLYIDYYTSWVDGKGTIQFRQDIYRKDDPIRKAMEVRAFPKHNPDWVGIEPGKDT